MTRLHSVQPVARVCRADRRCFAGRRFCVRANRAEWSTAWTGADARAAQRPLGPRRIGRRHADADSRRDGERQHDQSGRPGAGRVWRQHAKRARSTGALSLQEALRRGLEYNLGALNLGSGRQPGARPANGRAQRAAAEPRGRRDAPRARQVNLAALGVGTGRHRARLQLSDRGRTVQPHRHPRAAVADAARSDRLEQLPGEL